MFEPEDIVKVRSYLGPNLWEVLNEAPIHLKRYGDQGYIWVRNLSSGLENGWKPASLRLVKRKEEEVDLSDWL